jgi:hypothetical protein
MASSPINGTASANCDLNHTNAAVGSESAAKSEVGAKRVQVNDLS